MSKVLPAADTPAGQSEDQKENAVIKKLYLKYKASQKIARVIQENCNLREEAQVYIFYILLQGNSPCIFEFTGNGL